MRDTSNQKKLIKIITMPIRVLKKGKDMYEKSIMDVAQKPIYGSKKKTGSMKKGQTISGDRCSGGLSKSLSTTSVITRSENHENIIELVRANSTSTMELMEMEVYLKQLIKEEQMRKVKELMNKNNLGKSKSLKRGVPRSCSVGMGRIDEDKAVEFDVQEKEVIRAVGGKKIKGLYSRSRSHVIN